MQNLQTKLGIVVIGRNEGKRLKRCLRSLQHKSARSVYVDSGSTDGSTEYAQSLGVHVVELDMSRPFTMARGRNAGFKHLLEIDPTIELVQFIDGDCELVEGYLDAAVQVMHAHPEITVVAGRRTERYPDASIYNRLCDIEWGRDIGEIQSCGGDMMVRADAFLKAGMFNPEMIAGEEPELCIRLREAGGKIFRINHDMTIHDAAMYKFSQWWKRSVRGGHAYAEGCAMHGRPPHFHKRRQVQSVLLWGAAVPLASITFAIAAFWWPPALTGTAAMLLGYLILFLKIQRSMLKRGFNSFDARLYAGACVVGKFPSFNGIFLYWVNRIRKKKTMLIEYKKRVSPQQHTNG
jgi:GT2 family glycosyltransferase